MFNRKVAAWFIIAAAIAFGCLTYKAFGVPTSKRPNGLGVSEIYQNPNTYLIALPVEGQILDGKYTNIRFQPYATAELFDESILFCGNAAEQFDGKSGPVAITYRTRAAGMYRGVGCHELISVFSVTP